MSATNESGLTNNIRKAILKEYPCAWIIKVAGGYFQQPGIPDLLVCVDGKLIGLEVKFQRPGESLKRALGRATELQLHQIKLIQEAGGVAGVVASVEQALQLIHDSRVKNENN